MPLHRKMGGTFALFFVQQCGTVGVRTCARDGFCILSFAPQCCEYRVNKLMKDFSLSYCNVCNLLLVYVCKPSLSLRLQPSLSLIAPS
jgi:hypothetical protein